MKSYLLFIAVVIGCLSIEAAYGKGLTPRPVMEAELQEMDGDGRPIQSLMHFLLTLNKAGERSHSFTLVETFGSKCPPGAYCILPYFETRREFRIFRSLDAGCGSRRLFAKNFENGRISLITVLDHTRRLCDDYQPYSWVVSLRDYQKKTRSFVGNAKPIDAPGDPKRCAEIAEKAICTMQYAPSSCRATTLNGDPLDKPIAARGGNPCLGAVNVKTAACEKGLEWWKLRDEEIECFFTSEVPCPMFMCAAPPEGCRYVPEPKLDPRGCATSCGTLVCEDPVSPQ